MCPVSQPRQELAAIHGRPVQDTSWLTRPRETPRMAAMSVTLMPWRRRGGAVLVEEQSQPPYQRRVVAVIMVIGSAPDVARWP